MTITTTRLAASDLLIRDFTNAMNSNLLMPKAPIDIYPPAIIDLMIQYGTALFLTEDDMTGFKMAHAFSRYPKLVAWTGYRMGVTTPRGMTGWLSPLETITEHATAAIIELNKEQPAEFMVVEADKVSMNAEVEQDLIGGDSARATAFLRAGFAVRDIIYEDMAVAVFAYCRKRMSKAERDKLKMIREGYDG